MNRNPTILTGRDREHDWYAIRQCSGRGSTEQAAIDDLMRKERQAADAASEAEQQSATEESDA